MHLNSNIISQDDASATILVEVQEKDFGQRPDVFLVTVDKILGTAIAHNKGVTKHTRLSFVNADDDVSLEAGAVMAVLSFGE